MRTFRPFRRLVVRGAMVLALALIHLLGCGAADATDLETRLARTRGIYAFFEYNVYLDTFPFADKPWISGASVTTRWRNVEWPDDNTYYWNYINRQCQKAKAENLALYLHVLPGKNSPDYLTDTAGAPYITLDDGWRCPLPWSDTFANEWSSFIQELGNVCGDSEEIRMVAVTGPNAYTVEMMLAKSDTERAAWLAAGFDTNVIIQCWKDSLDWYAAAFPRALLVINMSSAVLDTYASNEGVKEAVFAYGVATYPDRFAIQYNALQEALYGFNTYAENYIQSFDRQCLTGFEQIVSYVTPHDTSYQFAGSMAGYNTAIDRAVSRGVEFLEIYDDDVFAGDAGIDGILMDADTELRRADAIWGNEHLFYGPRHSDVAVNVPGTASDSWLVLLFPAGDTTPGSFVAASQSDSGADYRLTTTLLSPDDSLTVQVWTGACPPALWLQIRSDTALLHGDSLPAWIPANDSGRQALSATAIIIEFAGADDRLLGDTATATEVSDTAAYTLDYDLSPATVQRFGALGFDVTDSSTSFGFAYADEWAGAWRQDTGVLITVSELAGGRLRVKARGGRLGGVVALGGNPLNCVPVALISGGDSVFIAPDTYWADGSNSADTDGPGWPAYCWTADSANVSIANPNDSVTAITVDTPGYYLVTLAVSDGADTGTDTAAIDACSPLPGDFTSRLGSGGRIDAQDLEVFSDEAGTSWGQAPVDSRTDLDTDGRLEFDDVAIFGTGYGGEQ